jgi:hypothetical protein
MQLHVICLNFSKVYTLWYQPLMQTDLSRQTIIWNAGFPNLYWCHLKPWVFLTTKYLSVPGNHSFTFCHKLRIGFAPDMFIWIFFTLCIPQTRMQIINIKKLLCKIMVTHYPMCQVNIGWWDMRNVAQQSYPLWNVLQLQLVRIKISPQRQDAATCIATAWCWYIYTDT